MTPIVAIWIAMGAAGILVDLVFLGVFLHDRHKLKNDHLNGGDEILNMMYVGVGIIAILKHIAVISIGLAVNVTPNTRGGQGAPITPITVVITCGLMLETALTVCTPAWVLWRRGILRKYLRSRAGTHFLTHLISRMDKALPEDRVQDGDSIH